MATFFATIFSTSKIIMSYSESQQMGRNWRGSQEDIMRDKRSVSDCFILCYIPRPDPPDATNDHCLPKFTPPEKNIPVPFKESVREIVNAIIDNQEIGGINIVDKIQEPNFRFTTEIDPEFGASLSEAFAILLARSRSLPGKKGAATALVTRNKKADAYATKMFDVIENMKAETGILTYQATIDLLNDKQVRTASGGSKWHIGTLQNLQKRWRELGLIPPKH